MLPPLRSGYRPACQQHHIRTLLSRLATSVAPCKIVRLVYESNG